MEHPLWKLADTSLPARVDIRERVLSVNTARVKVVKMEWLKWDVFVLTHSVHGIKVCQSVTGLF